MAGHQQSKEQWFPTGDSFDAQGTFVRSGEFWFPQLGVGQVGATGIWKIKDVPHIPHTQMAQQQRIS